MPKQYDFIRSERNICQNYNCHRWHKWMYEGRHMIPKRASAPPMKDHTYQSCWCNASCAAPLPLCGWRGMSPVCGASEKMLLEMVLSSVVLHQGAPKPLLAPCVSLCTPIGAICGNNNCSIYNFYLRPHKAMLFWHGKSLSVLINNFFSMQFPRSLAI